MDESFSDSESIDAKKYAVIVWALALTRGVLYDVVDGKPKIEEVQRILDITSLNSLANRIGCHENELAIDWNEYLSSSERDNYS
jgi:hypothetical protein